MPDYQGIGLGTKFLNEIAKLYINKYDFCIITSAKNLINALRKNDKWCLYRYNKKTQVTSKSSKIDKNRKLRDCVTAGFMYKK